MFFTLAGRHGPNVVVMFVRLTLFERCDISQDNVVVWLVMLTFSNVVVWLVRITSVSVRLTWLELYCIRVDQINVVVALVRLTLLWR